MADVFFVIAAVAFFAVSVCTRRAATSCESTRHHGHEHHAWPDRDGGVRSAPAPPCRADPGRPVVTFTFEYGVGVAIAALLAAYLVYALLFPERF
jgi:K+-transporting ATPase KdpF subunit